jgi:hypothetical protein
MKENNNPPRRRRPGRPVQEGPAHRAGWRARAEDAAERRNALRSTWLADAAWRPCWSRVVDAVARLTAAWPAVLAERVGATPPSAAWRLLAADGPLGLPCPSAAECVAATGLLRELLADEGRWPLDEGHVLALAADRGVSEWILTREAARLGIGRRAGQWLRPTPGWRGWLDPAVMAAVRALDAAEAERRAVAPLMRPLLDGLADHLETDRAWAALFRVLAPPSPRRLPPIPRTSAAARAQWLTVRTEYVRQRLAVRRGHRRRAELSALITAAFGEFRTSWWSGWPSAVLPAAGDHTQALERAEQLHAEALARLATLGRQEAAS